jgi:hypothetical protein
MRLMHILRLPGMIAPDMGIRLTLLAVFVAIIYIILFAREEPLRCPANLPVDEAVERGCPVLQKDVRVVMRV